MKKALVILMTVAMMFCFSATAFAANFSDMDNATDVVKDAVNKAVALEIINGYEDGTFKPDATITRAEFAKMACIAAGLKSSGEALSGTTPSFKDVKANEWYTGWINLASSKGFVRGYEDGTYKPNQTISNQEIVTVLMRMLGYNDNLTGPWPIDYINQAAKLDVTEDVAGFVGTAAATRGNVAVMMDATLDQYMVEYSKDIEDFAEKTKAMPEITYTWVVNPDYKPGDSGSDVPKFVQMPSGTTSVDRHYKLLEDSFDGYVVEDVTFTDWTVKNYDKQTFNMQTAAGTFEASFDKTAFSAGKNFFGSKGLIADVYYVNDNGTKVAKFVDVTSQKIDGEKLSAENGKVKLDGKSYVVAAETGKTANEMVDVAKENPANLYYTIYVNDDNEVFNVKSDSNGADFANDARFVKEVKSNERINYVGGGSENLKDEDYLLVKDNKVVAFDAIKAGDVLKVKGDADENVFEIVAAQTGKLSTYNDTKVTLGGVRYANNNVSVYDGDYEKGSEVKDYIGTEVLFAVNSDNSVNTIVAKEAASSTTLYGVITKLSKADNNQGDPTDEIETLTIFNQEGKSAKYDVKSEIAYVKNHAGKNFAVGNTVEFKLDKDGVIKTIKLISNQDDTDYTYVKDTNNVAETDKDTNRITLEDKKYTVNDSTYIFNITEDGSDYAVELMKKGDIITGDDVEANEVFGSKVMEAKIDGTRVVALFVTDINAAGDKYGFIEELNTINEDGDYTVKFYGNDTYYVLDDKSGLAEDDFVKYTTSGSDIDTMDKVEITRESGSAVTDISNGLLSTADKNQVELVDDTVYYEIKFTGKQADPDVEITVLTADDISETDTVVVQEDDGDAVAIVRVVDKTTADA